MSLFHYRNCQKGPPLVGGEDVTQINIALAKILIKEEVDAVMPGGDFSHSTGPMISPKSIREIFLPGMKKLSNFAHEAGVRVMSHNCRNNWKIMDILIEAGYEAYQSIQSKTASMDLKQGLSRVEKNTTL